MKIESLNFNQKYDPIQISNPNYRDEIDENVFEFAQLTSFLSIILKKFCQNAMLPLPCPRLPRPLIEC